LNCNICNCVAKPLYKGFILNKYEVQYFHCESCGFTQTEEPYWLEEAYSDAISVSDTGVMARNLYLAKLSKIILSVISIRKGKFLDFGGGYGIFTRMMRDRGFDFYWYDKFATNLVARGFEGNTSGKVKYDAVTSFENFEHLLNPLEDIEKMLSISDMVLFSTELMPQNLPKTDEWWYYCLEHGQHISIFSYESLSYIAEKYGFYFVSDAKNIHMFCKKKVSPKIFFLAKLMARLGLDKLIYNKSKTVQDMNDMIQEMKLK